MSALIILIAIAAVPFVLALMLRVNAIYLFTAVASGTILAAQWGADLETMVDGFTKYQHVDVVAHLVLLVLPVLLCFLFLRQSMPASQVLLQIVPLAAVSASLGILAINMLPKDVQRQLYGTHLGTQAEKLQNIIIAGTAVLVLVLMYISARHSHKKGLGKHKKHA